MSGEIKNSPKWALALPGVHLNKAVPSWTRVGKQCWERVLGVTAWGGWSRNDKRRKASRIREESHSSGTRECRGGSESEVSWCVCLFESTLYVI